LIANYLGYDIAFVKKAETVPGKERY
jgi:hypothetical protein